MQVMVANDRDERTARTDQTLPRPVSLEPPRLDATTNEEILEYCLNSWRIEDILFDSIHHERIGFLTRPEPLRHPLVFYLGHTPAFYINKLCLAGANAQSINARFEQLFAEGV